MLIPTENSSNDIKRVWELLLQHPVKPEGGQSREAVKHIYRYIVLLRSPL